MKYCIGLVGLAGLAGMLGAGCVDMVSPACYPEDSYEVTEDEEPETFARALAFEEEVRLPSLQSPTDEAGRLRVIDVESVMVQDEDICGTPPEAVAFVSVEFEMGEDLAIVVPGWVSLPEDGTPSIEFHGTGAYDPSMRMPYTAPEQWRISGIHASTEDCGRRIAIEALITPDVCEDAEDCEHNKLQSILTLETDEPSCW